MIAEVMDAEFWTKVIACVAAIVVSVPILIFVKKRDRNFERDLKKKFARLDRAYAKLLKQQSVSRSELIDVARRLNALYKLAQQAAYEDDNMGFDQLKALLGEAREGFLNYKLFRTADAEDIRARLENAQRLTRAAEEMLERIRQNSLKVRGKR